MSAAPGKQDDPLERWHHDVPQKFELECASSGVDIHSQKHGTIFKALDFDSLHAKGWIDKYDELFYPQNQYIKAADAQLPTDQDDLRIHSEYTFLGLCNNRGRILGPPNLGYLVGLAGSTRHPVSEVLPAKRILEWLFDEEEQVESAAQLSVRQQQFLSRYFRDGYYPQTPVMLTKTWSPIGAMIERGLNPVVLTRERRVRAVATGIWQPTTFVSLKPIQACKTDEDLFWAVLSEAFQRAAKRKLLVSVIAEPGWSYETKAQSLGRWSGLEVARADRILWHRTPEE